jgi:hypothetical protein
MGCVAETIVETTDVGCLKSKEVDAYYWASSSYASYGDTWAECNDMDRQIASDFPRCDD